MKPTRGAGLRLLVSPERQSAFLWQRHAEEPTPESRLALFETYQARAANMGLQIFQRSGDKSVTRAECMQLAMEALLQSIDRFDPARDTNFEGFLRPRIKGSIQDAIGRASERGAQYAYRRRVETERLRSMRSSEHQAEAGAGERLRSMTAKLALGFMLEIDTNAAMEEIPDSAPSALEILAFRQTLNELDRKLRQLPQRESFILTQHYRMGLQFTEIAALLGLSKGRVSQLHAAGLDRLRKQMSRQG